MSVVLGAGRRVQAEPRRRYAKLKGYAQHRRDYDRRRRLSKRSEQTLDYMAIIGRDPCAFCGAAAAENLRGVSDRDHIRPLSLGGEDSWENMTAACARCNRGRRDTPVLQYLLKRAAR